MHLKLSDIATIQLDHTSRCNCACPQCARTNNPNLPITDLTIDDYKKILEPFNGINLLHCGNYGDAIVSPTFDETYDYCLTKNVNNIKIMTNGSMRTPEWWRELALKSGKKLTVLFNIDGLQDTNHLYRVGSDFTTIMKNAKAFIDAGGIAEWVFIKFAHNYHQVDEAEQLAKDLGFSQFSVKTSVRFVVAGVDTIQNKDNIILHDTPSSHVQSSKDAIIKRYGSFTNYVNATPIACKTKENKTIFIDMCMNIWPCCWMAAPIFFNKQTEQTMSYDHISKLYGDDFNNLRIHTWDILNHEFFNKYLQHSWTNPTNKYKRIYTCGRTCGDMFAYNGADQKNIIRKSIT